MGLLALVLMQGLGIAVEFPDTVVGLRAKEIVVLLNEGDQKKAEKYINRYYAESFRDAFPMDMHLGIIKQVHDNFECLELKEIRNATETSMDMSLWSSSKDAWLDVQIVVEDRGDHRIVSLGIRPGSSPVESVKTSRQDDSQKDESFGITVPDRDLTPEKITNFVDSLIDSLVSQDQFSGAVLVAMDGEPFYKRAVGEACKRYHVPNRIDTKFNLGSMNKMFTGVAIMQLVQQEKLSLNDTVGRFLPDYPNDEVRESVTIHHLLTHTSGMGQYWQELFENPHWPFLKTVEDFDNLANTNPLNFKPGERFQYSNCGPLVLGLIIEKISGMDYHAYIRRTVTGPAGMTNTDCYDVDVPIPNLAIGYTKRSPLGVRYETWHNNLFTHPTKGCPAGGGYSTVEDLLKFDIALRQERLLKKHYFDLMTTGKTNRDSERRYAYLFQEKIINGYRIIGHSGGALGINSNLSMYMDSGYTVAIMSNYDNGMVLLNRRIEKLLTQNENR